MTERILNTHIEWVEPENAPTSEEIIDLCCEKVNMDPCVNYGRVTPWAGEPAEPPDDLPYDPRRRNVIVELVGPDGDCGEMHEEWQDSLDCCDLVLPMVWGDSGSVEVLADWDSGLVTVIGGKPPYTWKVRGNGFYTDSARRYRDAETSGPVLQIFTAKACGACDISVTDGCSSASGWVRSVNGAWKRIGDTQYGGCAGLSYDYQGGYVYIGKMRYHLVTAVDCHYCWSLDADCLDTWPVFLRVGDYDWLTDCRYWSNSCQSCQNDCRLSVRERIDYMWVC